MTTGDDGRDVRRDVLVLEQPDVGDRQGRRLRLRAACVERPPKRAAGPRRSACSCRACSIWSATALRRAGADRDQDHDGRDADQDAEHGQAERSLFGGDAAERDPEAVAPPRRGVRSGGGAVSDRSSSPTIWPSRRRITRWRARGDVVLVGDHHDRAARRVELAEDVHHLAVDARCRGCRSARRRGSARGR